MPMATNIYELIAICVIAVCIAATLITTLVLIFSSRPPVDTRSAFERTWGHSYQPFTFSTKTFSRRYVNRKGEKIKYENMTKEQQAKFDKVFTGMNGMFDLMDEVFDDIDKAFDTEESNETQAKEKSDKPQAET